MANGAGQNAGGAAARQQAAKVDDFIIRRTDIESDIGIVKACDGDGRAGRQYQIAIRAFNQAALGVAGCGTIFDARCDQHHFAARRGLDIAMVGDRASGAITLEFKAAVEKVLISNLQGRQHHAGRVH